MKRFFSFPEKSASAERRAIRVTGITIAANLALSVFKILTGLFAASGAMVSDGVHSASDVFSSFIVIIGIRLSGKAPDRDHPYGHERFESAAALVLASLLALTGVLIAKSALELLISGAWRDSETPGVLALAAAGISIAVKEGMFWYTRYHAKALKSDAMMADAWHHRSDALSSIGALIGIGGARLGFPILEPIASLVICLMIEKAAVDIFRAAVQKMVDRSCSPETEEAIRAAAARVPGVLGVDKIQTRQFGSRIYVDLEIAVEGSRTLIQAHAIAQQVHDAVEENFEEVKHVMVHVNPAGEKE